MVLFTKSMKIPALKKLLAKYEPQLREAKQRPITGNHRHPVEKLREWVVKIKDRINQLEQQEKKGGHHTRRHRMRGTRRN